MKQVLNGSEIVLECLKEQGVDTVFGYPGGAILNIYDELYKQSDKIHHDLPPDGLSRSEQIGRHLFRQHHLRYTGLKISLAKGAPFQERMVEYFPMARVRITNLILLEEPSIGQ